MELKRLKCAEVQFSQEDFLINKNCLEFRSNYICEINQCYHFYLILKHQQIL